jgi:hypothetical protein
MNLRGVPFFLSTLARSRQRRACHGSVGHRHCGAWLSGGLAFVLTQESYLSRLSYVVRIVDHKASWEIMALWTVERYLQRERPVAAPCCFVWNEEVSSRSRRQRKVCNECSQS